MPKVLVVDDSLSVRKVVEKALTGRGVEVLSAATGTEAMEAIEQERPDIVVCDVILPDKDGYKVCEFVRAHPAVARIPVLLISGVVNSTVLARAAEVQSNDVMFKPFAAEELVRKIEGLLGSRVITVAPASPAPCASVAPPPVPERAPTPSTAPPPPAPPPPSARRVTSSGRHCPTWSGPSDGRARVGVLVPPVRPGGLWRRCVRGREVRSVATRGNAARVDSDARDRRAPRLLSLPGPDGARSSCGPPRARHLRRSLRAPRDAGDRHRGRAGAGHGHSRRARGGAQRHRSAAAGRLTDVRRRDEPGAARGIPAAVAKGATQR